MKKVFLKTLIILAMPCIVHAQKNFSLSLKDATNIRFYLPQYYKVKQSFIDTICLNTIVFAKFKITDDHIDSLTFSGDAPVEIKNSLKAAFMATNGLWKSTEEEKKELKDKIFLLPVIFHYQSGCTPASYITLEQTKPLKESFHAKPMHDLLNNTFKFDDGSSYRYINCILLNPMSVGQMD